MTIAIIPASASITGIIATSPAPTGIVTSAIIGIITPIVGIISTPAKSVIKAKSKSRVPRIVHSKVPWVEATTPAPTPASSEAVVWIPERIPEGIIEIGVIEGSDSG
jgi:hypothetical protein